MVSLAGKGDPSAISFLDYWSRRDEFLKELDECIEDARSNAPHECDSAVRIQRLFRGALARTKLKNQIYGQISIARSYRGHLGRKRAHIFACQRWDLERV